MSASISRDEWLAALGDAAQPCDPNALTVREAMTMFDMSAAAAARKLAQLVVEGRAVQTYKRVAGPSGISKRVPAYRLVKSKR